MLWWLTVSTRNDIAHVELLEEFLPVDYSTACRTICHKVEQLGCRFFLRVPRLPQATNNRGTKKDRWAGRGRTPAIQKCVFTTPERNLAPEGALGACVIDREGGGPSIPLWSQ